VDDSWKNCLAESGAVSDETGGIAHFGDSAAEAKAAIGADVIAPLSAFGLVTAAGEDAATFLQGQLTNDIRRIDAGHSQLSGYCTPKGRLLAIPRIFRRGEDYQLLLPAALLDTTLTRLARYVLRSKVTLTRADERLAGFGLSGPAAERLRGTLGADAPAAVNETIQAGELSVLRIAGIHPRFLIFGPHAAIAAAWRELRAQARPVGQSAWALLDIVNGIPHVEPATVEEFIPQTVNLDLLGAIAFDKGCYTGQEIVARLHYRGTVKRRMYLAHCTADTAPRAGAAVHAHGSEQAVGHVVNAAADAEGGFLLLASLVHEQALQGGLHLAPAIDGNADGAALTLRDLPYLAAGAAD
jgi:folate-binding protein YgfZ